MKSVRFNARGKRLVEALEDECRKLGLPRPRFEKGGKHHKAYVIIDGQERMLNVSSSPSDGNAHRQKVRDLHRLIREMRGA